MEPTHKSPELEAEIVRMFGHDRRAAIEANLCVPAPIGCGQPIELPFPSAKYELEYRLSGLCARCQDKVFGTDGESEDVCRD